MMKTLILCGGKGTRAHPYTQSVPKPLLEVAGRPVLEHVMELYARQGFCDFVLAAGYKAELIEKFAASVPVDWNVVVVDTGAETGTGGRVRACRALLGDRCFVTYADGLGDVDLHALAAFHDEHDGAATMTSVPLPSQYGTVVIRDAGRVLRFTEKPRLDDHWINAGFFVLDDRALDFFTGDDLEKQVLPALAESGELYAFRHDGFWKSMDTYKDAMELTALCDGVRAPWLGARGVGRPDVDAG